jgi:hypothetical protein
MHKQSSASLAPGMGMSLSDILTTEQLIMSKFCQSCGMPMKKDPSGGGTNADGSNNTSYCSYCYQNGSFTQPDFTAKQMQEFCIEKLREKSMLRILGWLLARNIPNLERWKKIIRDKKYLGANHG